MITATTATEAADQDAVEELLAKIDPPPKSDERREVKAVRQGDRPVRAIIDRRLDCVQRSKHEGVKCDEQTDRKQPEHDPSSYTTPPQRRGRTGGRNGGRRRHGNGTIVLFDDILDHLNSPR